MTILDVIKYPISNPPTEEELCNLPVKVIIQWREYIKYIQQNKFNEFYDTSLSNFCNAIVYDLDSMIPACKYKCILSELTNLLLSYNPEYVNF